MRVWLICAVGLLVAGCGGKSIAGRYHIEQDGSGFGPGAEKIELNMTDDKKFKVEAGPMTMFEGTWSEANGDVTWNSSSSNDQIATTYKVKDGKLVPQSGGKEITFWRWVRK